MQCPSTASLMAAGWCATGPVWASGEWDKFCAETAQYAETTIRDRHQGVPMQRAVEATKGSVGQDLHRTIIADAYTSPRFTAEEVVQRSVEDFRDKWYLRCAQNDPEKIIK